MNPWRISDAFKCGGSLSVTYGLTHKVTIVYGVRFEQIHPSLDVLKCQVFLKMKPHLLHSFTIVNKRTSLTNWKFNRAFVVQKQKKNAPHVIIFWAK